MMPQTTRKHGHSLGDGVYYAAEDYVGIMPRLVIFFVDSLVLAAVYLLLGSVFVSVTGDLAGAFWLTSAILTWAYLSVVKASKIRTVGYWVTGSRIVNLRGERPAILRMTFRTLLWAFGPFNVLFDLIWSGIDDDRQTLRDRYAGTCVIKHGAEPIGSGEIQRAYFHAFGFALIYNRVPRPAPETPEA